MKKTMLILTLGFVMGMFAAGSVVATAYETRIIGGDGFLMGVEVTDDDGDTICTDPYYWSSTKELECD